MRKLLFSSLLIPVLSCQQLEPTKEPSAEVTTSEGMLEDTTESKEPKKDDLAFEAIQQDSVRAIKHGSPDQEKLDSIKRLKGEKKSKG